MQLEVILAGNRIATSVLWSSDNLSQYKDKNEKWKLFLCQCCLKTLSCPQTWNIKKEKDREKEKIGDKPAKLNEKKSDGELEREIKSAFHAFNPKFRKFRNQLWSWSSRPWDKVGEGLVSKMRRGRGPSPGSATTRCSNFTAIFLTVTSTDDLVPRCLLLNRTKKLATQATVCVLFLLKLKIAKILLGKLSFQLGSWTSWCFISYYWKWYAVDGLPPRLWLTW